MYTVLYVDDEPDLLVLGREFLQRSEEFRVVTRIRAQDALGSAEIGTCDAIVSDYQMADMDGIAFLKAVREQYGDIPFILFTGRGREEVVIQAINNGADFYLQKGGDVKAQFAELGHKIRQAIARRQAEHSLVESEKRLTDIINFLPDATFAIDRAGRVIAWNHAIEEMTGVPAGEMLGRGDYEYAVPFYGERRPVLIDMIFEPDAVLVPHYAHISRDRGSLMADTTRPRPRGRPRTLMATASPLFDRQGGIAGAIESIRDISELRSSEEALRASEEKYRLVVEHSQDAIYIHRADRLLFANTRASELTGYTHGELMEIRLWDLLHPDDRAGLAERATKRFAGEAVPSGFTARLLTKDGRERPCEFFVDLVNFQGAPAILGIARDITARREAEDALRASEARFRELAELLPLIIFETDRDLRVTYMNRQASSVIGVAQDEIERGCAASDFLAEKDRERAQENIGKIIRGESFDHHEYGVVRRDGTAFPAMIYAAPILLDGAFAGLRGVIVDITGRKQMEDALRESEETYRTLVEGFDGLIYVCSKDRRVEFMNRRMIERTGRDATGEPCYRALHGRDSVCPWCVNDRVFAGERVVWEGQSPLDNRWNHIVNIPIRHADGSVSKMAMLSDITERKQAEEALRKSEERFQMAIEASDEGLVDWDMASDTLYLSPRSFTMFGYTPEEPSFKTFMNLLHPDDRDRVSRLVSEFRGGERSDDEIEFRLRTRDGEWRWVLSRAKVTARDAVGRPVRLVGTITDITPRKQAEEALRESEQQFQALTESSQAAIAVYRPDLVYANPAAERLTGYSREELSGMDFWALAHPDDREEIRRRVLSRLRGEPVPAQYEFRILRKGGETRWVEISATAFTYQGATASLSVLIDITERKRAEEALRRGEAEFREFFNNTGDAIVIHDLQGRFLEVNDEICRRLGYSRDEMLAMRPGDIDEPEYGEQVTARIRTLQETGSAVFETVHRGKDGTRIPTEVSSRLITYHGAPAVLSTGRDITSRKRAEEAIHEANRKLNLLNTITRHDVMNQLTALEGYVQLACMKKPDPSVTDFLRKIREAAETIERQIAFTRVYQELGVTAPSWFALDEVVAKASGTAAPVRFSGTCRAVRVLADPMLERVFFNLFENAVRHGKRVTAIAVRCEREPDGLLVIVEDDGVGIKPHEKEKIFTKGYGKHTGFGLFLAREILAITGITIRETGSFGKGARFEMLVPKGVFRLPEAP